MSLAFRIRRALLRLPRNLASNRWYVLTLGRLFFASSRHSRYVNQLLSAAGTKLNTPAIPTVYVRPLYLFRGVTQVLPASIGFLFPHLGRFGNAVREIVSAAALARRANFGHLVLQGFSLFSNRGELANPGYHGANQGISIWIENTAGHAPAAKPPLVIIRWSQRHFPRANEETAWRDAERVLPPGLGKKAWGSETLAIHIRGGDVFGDRKPRSYGQPPLAFYLWVLAHGSWSRVVIVHQDESNPVLEPLISAVKNQGRHLEVFCGSLRDDLSILLGATTIVAGRGTFIPAVVGLSQRVKHVFYFENKFDVFPRRKDVKITRVVDSVGDYRRAVLEDNWSNSSEQRELMVSYPQTQIGLS